MERPYPQDGAGSLSGRGGGLLHPHRPLARRGDRLVKLAESLGYHSVFVTHIAILGFHNLRHSFGTQAIRVCNIYEVRG